MYISFSPEVSGGHGGGGGVSVLVEISKSKQHGWGNTISEYTFSCSDSRKLATVSYETRGLHPNGALLTFIIPYEINSEWVHIDPEGNDRTMESNNNAKKITSLHKGAACPKNTLNMQRRVSHGYACTDTLPSWIHSGFLSKAAFNIAIWLIRWFIPVFCINNTEIHK